MDKGKSIRQNSPKNVKSSVLKMGAKTLFFDVNLAANDKKYLKITESRFTGEGNDRVRNSVVLFPENIEGCEKSLKEVVSYLN
ncbi:hypothetical protein A2165_03190 [Candidatus Curtissbacteria bacterium RBG_13_40_7]|uniref:Uncharacterized protein n=1 Tax=Candidatus Curtissbacteria bacterium RBG_13_40_7 TaxID=1797706 RepID=A0A1F5FYQ7_9BACT|nr:MAG: hypothetical protein A2165_03190 [Candidatus Curtissbacteria bacterium RBG_13_40_7]